MLYLLLAAVVAGLDQFFKYWIVNNIPFYGDKELIPGIIHLTNIQNTGASFNMMEGMRWVLLGITAVCVAGIIIFLFKTEMKSILGKVAIAAVLGGAVGNAIDRARLGYVVDMFQTDFINFAIFNVADCFIVCGGIVFCICYFVWSGKKEKEIRLRTAKAKPHGRMPELQRLESDKDSNTRPEETKTAEEDETHGSC
ncbi:MAG: signal peptidase II [Oscillospiraceae bacterium]